MRRNEDDLVERVRPVQPWVMVAGVAAPVRRRSAAGPLDQRHRSLLRAVRGLLAPAGPHAGGAAPRLHGRVRLRGRALLRPAVGLAHPDRCRCPATLPPAQLIAALLLTGMLAGQFAHLWATQARRIAGLYTHQRQRFDEFARNYQLLKVSHDGLEERSAAARGNLRTAITTLRAELLRAPGAESALQTRAPFVLEVFQAFGQVQAAALLPVTSRGVEPPCATLGRVSDRVASDPLVAVALKTRRVASLAHMGRDGGEAVGDLTTSLAAAVPLVDVDGRVWAVLAIQELPFYAFTPENLSLFALMAGRPGRHAGVRGHRQELRPALDPALRAARAPLPGGRPPPRRARQPGGLLGQQRRPGQRAAAAGAGGAAGDRRGLSGAGPRRRPAPVRAAAR